MNKMGGSRAVLLHIPDKGFQSLLAGQIHIVGTNGTGVSLAQGGKTLQIAGTLGNKQVALLVQPLNQGTAHIAGCAGNKIYICHKNSSCKQ